jgi:hypothetical protein
VTTSLSQRPLTAQYVGQIMKLHEVVPRESAGRDTINRFKAQFKAASLECLALLENGELERIYCDYHEDYVVKHIINNNVRYRFVQVKTKQKQNHLYSVFEVFGLKKTKAEHDLPNSFAGKLLLHIESFGATCKSVVICTNVNFDDDVETIIKEAKIGIATSKHTTRLINETKKLFPSLSNKSEQEVLRFLAHLTLAPRKQILNEEEDNFVSLAHGKIFKYSEINLNPNEVRRIIIQLLSLIEKKSAVKLDGNITEDLLNQKASICINDILDILAISRQAYYILKEGGDPNAIKSVSILQRILKRNHFSNDVIEAFASFKSQWEAWFRTNRHSIPEFHLLTLNQNISKLTHQVVTSQIDMNTITPNIEQLTIRISRLLSRADITEDLVFGAVLSEIVKGDAT